MVPNGPWCYGPQAVTSVRSRCSFSNTGASEKVNRSSWLAARSENSVQDGTAMMSPRASGRSASSRRTEPAPSKTCQTEDAEVRDGRGGAGVRPAVGDAALSAQLELEKEGAAGGLEPGHAAIRYTNPTSGGQ